MPHMQEYRIRGVEELGTIVGDVLKTLRTRSENGAAVIALSGELGAGKTAFVQTLARTLGVRETVTSPTFVVMKKYETESAMFPHLVHIDAYRIEDRDEMRPLRFTDELAQNGAIIAIEWAERIETLLPPETIHIAFAIVGEERIITVRTKHDKED